MIKCDVFGQERGEEQEKSTAHGNADVGDLRQETNGAQTLKPKLKPQLQGATRPDCAMTSCHWLHRSQRLVPRGAH